MSEDTQAINAWFETDKAKVRCDPTTLKAPKESEQYLRNRIWETLVDGIKIGRRHQLSDDKKKLVKLLD